MRAMAPRTHMPYPCTATSLPLHCVSCVSPQRRATTSSAGLTDICCPSSVQKPHSASLSFSLAWANLRVAPRRPQPPRRPPQARPARRGPPRGRHASEATRTAGRVPCGGVRGPLKHKLKKDVQSLAPDVRRAGLAIKKKNQKNP